MVPLSAARIEDLGPGDFVRVQCLACGHDELLTADQLRIRGIALPPHTPVLDLEPKLRCRECDAKGKAMISVHWEELDRTTGVVRPGRGVALPVAFGRRLPLRIRSVLDERFTAGAYELDVNPSHADGGANQRTQYPRH